MTSAIPWTFVNQALKRILAADPDSLESLLALAPCTLVIDLEGITVIGVGITPDEVRLGPADSFSEAHLTLQGPPAAFAKLMRAEDDERVAALDALSVTGDVGRLQQLERWLRRVDIDWEELLARRIGDVAAHQVGNFVRHAGQHAREVRADFRDNLAEYLQYEARAVVTRHELDDWSRDVDALRDDVERLSVRLALLSGRIP